MITLALDAATYVGTVAIVDDDRVLAERETAMRGRDVERLMPAVAEALHDAGDFHWSDRTYRLRGGGRELHEPAYRGIHRQGNRDGSRLSAVRRVFTGADCRRPP